MTTVQLWRERFLALRAEGLQKDASRPGRLPAIPDHKVAAIVEATLHHQPPNATHWSTRLMAKTQGVSEATVRRIWKRHGLRPHRISTFKVSRDPQFVQKLIDVVGLYLNPPDKALVFCMDRTNQFLYVMKGSAAQLLLRQISKPTFDQVEPRRRRGRKVQVKTRIAAQPAFDAGVLVGSIVIHDQVQLEFSRSLDRGASGSG